MESLRHGIWSLAIGSLLSALPACVREAQHPCSSPKQCEAEASCSVGRCRVDAELPKLKSRRVVIQPNRVALCASGIANAGDLPTIALGKGAVGDVLWLLDYDAEQVGDREIKLATLSFSRPSHAAMPLAEVALEVAVALEPWDPNSVSWGRQPRIDGLRHVGNIGVHGVPLARVDVTEVVRRARSHKSYGLAVAARGGDPVGATVYTGLGMGSAPQLELYLE